MYVMETGMLRRWDSLREDDFVKVGSEYHQASQRLTEIY